MSKELQINEQIRDAEVRLIDADGSQLGIVKISKAIKIASDKNLDLVKIADKADPPVCKVMNYGKYKYEQSKREKESRQKQHVVDIKEIRLSLNIGTHDFETKVDHARKFASKGDKVKVTIRFRGREMGHPEIGIDLMQKFADSCIEFADVERKANLEGRSMIMFLSPKSKKM